MLSKARFHSLLAHTRKKERVASGRFFVEGWRWLEEVLALPAQLHVLIATRDAARTPAERALLARAQALAAEFLEATPEQLGRLTETVSAPGVAALVEWRPQTPDALPAALPPSPPGALLVALDAVADPGNAGTIVRTADWFGADGVIFGAGSVEPANPKCRRATMGSLFHLPVFLAGQLAGTLQTLRGQGMSIVGAALDGQPLPEFRWPSRAVLVIGNEANGLQVDVAATLDHRVKIPAFGRAESLNAAVAAGVLLADWRQRAGWSSPG